MKHYLTILLLLILISYKNEKSHSQNAAKTENIKSNSIIGIWTDGSTENATMEIKKESIYYIEHLESYPYILKNDSIEINYSTYIYKAKISFRNDTLIMNSKEFGVSKFWKFN